MIKWCGASGRDQRLYAPEDILMKGQVAPMNRQSWDTFGEEIKHTVQNAVDSQNFGSLNRSVKNALDRTFFDDIPPLLFKNVRWTRIWAILSTALGGVLSLSMLIPFLLLIIFRPMFPTPGRILADAVTSFLFCGGIGMTAAGILRLRKVRRFRIYIEELGTKGYFDIRVVARQLNRSVKYVVRDLKSFIRRKWFLEGRLDRQQICFMASDDVYGQYLALMDHVEAQRLKENEEKEKLMSEQKKRAQMDPKVREALAAGQEYVRRIRQCNDEIPGEEISAKISKIEDLADKIFDRVEENPACLPDIRRLMEYYLPTTVKLLEAYAELDVQSVQGENILASKKEIEETLDTLNVAFSKLLDSLFREKAWDVSSDISVLRTMLAQEGLTKKDFKE